MIPPVPPALGPETPSIGAPPGFATVFAGWNVWDLWQAADPDESLLGALWHAGISQDQLLKLWVENQIEDNAPGANISDPLNPDPEHFRGDEIQILPGKPDGLAVAAGRESAGLGGALQVGKKDSAATFRTVRFFNRGQEAILPWPHDQNFVLDVVYQPSATNPITNSAPPSTAGGTIKAGAAAAEKALGELVTVAAWGLGGIALILLISKMRSRP
jgi:hypothetical protein